MFRSRRQTRRGKAEPPGGLVGGGQRDVLLAALYVAHLRPVQADAQGEPLQSKALFTEEEWIAKNRWYAEREATELDSMTVDVAMDGEERAEVTVYRTFTDGTEITRDTVFVWEGYWRHHLTEEEKEIFMPGVPYEEFVEAQG